MRAITGKPIVLIGTGEKIDALEPFHPERIAGRILGMGDVVTLVERAAETADQDEAERLAAKFQKGNFDLDDLAAQLRQLRRIAAGSGTSVPDINRLLKQYQDMAGMMKKMKKLGQKGLMRHGLSALMPGGGFRH